MAEEGQLSVLQEVQNVLQLQNIQELRKLILWTELKLRQLALLGLDVSHHIFHNLDHEYAIIALSSHCGVS